MRRGSFRSRLILGAVVWITVGMTTSWFMLTTLLRDRVVTEFESELDHHATELAAIVAVDPTGALTITQPLSDQRFATMGSGHYWQIERANGQTLRSGSLGAHQLRLSVAFGADADEHVTTGPGPEGSVLMVERSVPARPAAEPVRVGVAIETREVDAVMAGLRRTLGLSLAVIALGLIAAAVAQVAFGLRPLSRIRQALNAIRMGQARRLPDDLPSEVAPLARRMNDVLAANEDVVQRARIQAGNLAHALKTPLAILMDEARRLEASGQSGEVLLRECERMRRQIDHHLARARATASSANVTAAAPLVPALRSLVTAIARLHQDRGLRFDMPENGAGIVVACEAEDLDEMLGNLLDNAAKWARSTIAIRIAPLREGKVRVVIEDDGSGIPEAAHERVFEVGQRLDEQLPGSGLGLAIVRDVAAAYGGRTGFETSSLGGVAVWIELPVLEEASIAVHDHGRSE